MARLSLTTAIDTTTRGQRLQAAATGFIFAPDILAPSILTDLASSGYTVSTSDYDEAAVIVTYSTTISVSNNSETLVAWDTEATNADSRGFHDNATNNTRLTVPANYGGIYFGIARISFPGNTAGRRLVTVYLNGTATSVGQLTVPTGGNSNTIGISCPFVGVLVATDYVEVKAYQDSGGALTITPVSFSMFRAVRI